MYILGESILNWVIFFSITALMLLMDLGIFNKKDQVITFKQSILLSIFYISISLLFSIYILYSKGLDVATEYWVCFFIEKTMSIDNIFVIITIFTFFNVPRIYQHKVLFWGILGVIVLRGIFIIIGSALIAKFSWILYVLAVMIIMTSIKILCLSDKPINIEELYFYKLIKNRFNVTSKINSNNFFVTINNKIYITPLFISLLLIEMMDIVFAIDSIPAIFAITKDPYVIYTSNIFAILGLRALFFCIDNIMVKFKYLKYSLSVILFFIGAKILVHHFIIIPIYFTLIFSVIVISSGIILSMIWSNH